MGSESVLQILALPIVLYSEQLGRNTKQVCISELIQLLKPRICKMLGRRRVVPRAVTNNQLTLREAPRVGEPFYFCC